VPGAATGGGENPRGAFGEVTADIVRELSGISGESNVLTGRESREAYAHDETEDLSFLPDVVVRPANAREISRLLSLATLRRIPVTPRAGGTGLSGGALPVHGGIVLSLERLNRILEIDTANLQAVAEP
jgi:glycolate oxidase